MLYMRLLGLIVADGRDFTGVGEVGGGGGIALNPVSHWLGERSGAGAERRRCAWQWRREGEAAVGRPASPRLEVGTARHGPHCQRPGEKKGVGSVGVALPPKSWRGRKWAGGPLGGGREKEKEKKGKRNFQGFK